MTPASEQEHAQVGELAVQIQQTTGDKVELAWVDQGYTGEQPAQDIRLEVVRFSEAKMGFVPRRTNS